MKINIQYEFKDGPYGGGNQFLKALKKEFIRQNVYEENLNKADVCLVNSFPSRNPNFLIDPIKNKIKNKNFKIIYRLDGLFYINRLNEKQKKIDNICKYFANNFVDGIIYQTEWIKTIQQEYGIDKNIKNDVIINAPDKDIFFLKNKELKNNEKIQLVSTCWAANERKGFKYYKYLDENLDFKKYEMTFIGNSPIEFKNIKKLDPLNTKELAKQLEKKHIFISAAFNEPCSNSIIEAMHIGLPVVGHNSGGTPEIVKKGGELFFTEKDLLEKIEKVAKNYNFYKNNINLLNIEEVAKKYYSFLETIYKSTEYKKINKINYFLFLIMILKQEWKYFVKKFLKIYK